jgi:hypothetical protein
MFVVIAIVTGIALGTPATHPKKTHAFSEHPIRANNLMIDRHFQKTYENLDQ